MWVYYISFGIILLGFITAFIFFIRAFKSSRSILHYQNIRDALTLKKKKKKPKEDIKPQDKEEKPIGGIIGSIMGLFVTLLVGVSLIGPISEQVNIALKEVESEGNSLQILMLQALPAFFIITILIVVITGILNSINILKEAGLG